MNIVFYIVIFILGTILGSLYATTIERMSKEKKTFSLHSYCTKCGKKLKATYKIPILSYLYLHGKCKYCGKPIAVKYIFLEIITGFIFLITALAFKCNITTINITKLISFLFTILYFTYIILVIGIDIETRKIPSTLLALGNIISIAYIIYLLFMESTTANVAIVYLVIMVILLLLNILNTKKKAQSSYVLDILSMVLIMLIFTGEFISILTIIGTLLTFALYNLIKNAKKTKYKIKTHKGIFEENTKIAFIMGIINIVIFLVLINA